MYAYAGWAEHKHEVMQGIIEFGSKGASELRVLEQVRKAYPEVFGQGEAVRSREMMEASARNVNSEGNYNVFIFIVATDDGRLVTERIW